MGDVASGRLNRVRFAEIAYLAFLVMVFVGVTPFAMPQTAPGIDPASTSGAGDLLRQVSYLAVFVLILVSAWMGRGWQSISAIPLLLIMLLGWCMLSAAWSIEPSVTFRRAVLLAIVSASAFIAVDTIGAARSLHLLRYVLAGIVIVNWLSILFIPQARHLANDFEPGVAGDWRGLYGHKNTAGAVCANAAIIFFCFAVMTRRRVDVLLGLANLGFLVGTNSKSSLGLLPIAILAGGVYFLCARNRVNRQIVLTGALLAGAVAAAAVWAWWAALVPLLQDPDLFTGRSAIWQAEIAYIRDHPLLGSGFGTFAFTGKSSPIYQYIDSSWIGGVASGHQGYLEVLVTIGIPGFVMTLLVLLVQPVAWFAQETRLGPGTKALLFALFAFFFMHNFMETNFLQTDGTEWVTFLLVLAMLRTSRAGMTMRMPDFSARPSGVRLLHPATLR